MMTTRSTLNVLIKKERDQGAGSGDSGNSPLNGPPAAGRIPPGLRRQDGSSTPNQRLSGLRTKEGSASRPGAPIPTIPIPTSLPKLSPLPVLNAQQPGPSSTRTRGGIPKKEFKPTIAKPLASTSTKPNLPLSNGNAPNGKDESKGKNESRKRQRGDTSLDRKPNERRDRRKDNLIQLGGSVFGEGITSVRRPAGGISGLTRSRSTFPGESGVSSPPQKKFKAEEGDGITGIRRQNNLPGALNDDYDEDVKPDIVIDPLAPKGWQELLCGLENSSAKLAIKKEPDSLETDAADHANVNRFLESEEERLMIFQLSDILHQKPPGKIGKIRRHRSGRLDFIDHSTGIVYDLIAPPHSSQGWVRDLISYSPSASQINCISQIECSSTVVLNPTIPEGDLNESDNQTSLLTEEAD